jgi:hypothetical protein
MNDFLDDVVHNLVRYYYIGKKKKKRRLTETNILGKERLGYRV